MLIKKLLESLKHSQGQNNVDRGWRDASQALTLVALAEDPGWVLTTIHTAAHNHPSRQVQGAGFIF